MTEFKYCVYCGENGPVVCFDNEVDAMKYAREDTSMYTSVIVEKNEIDETGETVNSEVLWSASNTKVPEETTSDNPFNTEFPKSDIENVDISDDEYYDEIAKQYKDEKYIDTTPADWDDPNRFTEAVNIMEENESEVECKCCFDLFPKEDCVKTEKGYICQKCHQEMESHQGTNLDLIDADPFDLNYDDPRDPEEIEEPEVKEEPFDADENRKHEEGIKEAVEDKPTEEDKEELPEVEFTTSEVKEVAEEVAEKMMDNIETKGLNIDTEEWKEDATNIVAEKIEEKVETEENPEEETLEEHINDRPADIESDQKLLGTDNAIVDCEVAKVIAHSEDEKPLDCKMEKPALEKQLTENLSEDIINNIISKIPNELKTKLEVESYPVDDDEQNEVLGEISFNFNLDEDTVKAAKELVKIILDNLDLTKCQYQIWNPDYYETEDCQSIDEVINALETTELEPELYDSHLNFSIYPKENLSESNNKTESLNEDLKVIIDFSEYKPWSGAIETYELIKDADKLDELEAYLEECYPDGITETKINDILWFDGEEVLSYLGLGDAEDEEIETDKSLTEGPIKNFFAKTAAKVGGAVKGWKVIDQKYGSAGFKVFRKKGTELKVVTTQNKVSLAYDAAKRLSNENDVLMSGVAYTDGGKDQTLVTFKKGKVMVDNTGDLVKKLETSGMYGITEDATNNKELEAATKKALIETTKLTSNAKIGDRIRIIHLEGEDNSYDGKEGTVDHIDDIGQLHGSWGGLAVIPGVDEFEVITEDLKEQLNTKLQNWVNQQMEELFYSWVNLACDDWVELRNYGLTDGEEKEYAIVRMQEIADNQAELENIIEQMHDWPNYSEEFTDEDLAAAIKVYLKETGYLKENLEEAKAKPEGDRKQSYNDGLKLAKVYNKPVIYGYTNSSYGNKYFALDDPIICDNVSDETKKFRQQYKSCNVVYVAYPSGTLIERLLEDAPEGTTEVDYVEYKHSYCHALEPKLEELKKIEDIEELKKAILDIINNDPQVNWTKKEKKFAAIVRHKKWKSVEDLKTYLDNSFARAKEIKVLVDQEGELVKKLTEEINFDENGDEIFTPEEQEEFDCDEWGYSNEGYDQFHHCGWCEEIYPESEMRHEVDFGWICDRCQEELKSHGGPLTFIED